MKSSTVPEVDDAKVTQAILDAVAEVKGTQLENVDDDARLQDLGLDSLDLIEIGMIVEQRLGVIVPTERFDGIEALRQVVDVFVRAMAEQFGAAQ
jgi:acyl carrier protein